MRIPTFVWVVALVFVVYLILNSGACNRRPERMVGVGRSAVTSRLDLTAKLNPAILPDLVKEILREMAPGQKPESDKFQQEFVRRLSQRIMDDPDINYRVDLNEDQNMDPILVVPESVKGEAAVYSIRVPDPEKHRRDPAANADWGKIAETGIELCALSVTFDENAKKLVVDAETNKYLYEDSQRHYRAEYPARQNSFLETYMTFMIFRSVMFAPYMWYSPMWMGGWYGGYYGGWHGPVRSRPVARSSSRYRTASRATSPMRTASGANVRSSKASARSRPPAFVSSRQSRAAATRRSTRARSTRRSTSRSFRGGSYGYGK
jgi:hypothetical protein